MNKYMVHLTNTYIRCGEKKSSISVINITGYI